MARILLVEDDEQVSEVLERLLARAGHDVARRRTGGDGLAVQRAEPADLVVMDLCTPGLSGIDALAEMRSAGDETPVLAITGAIVLLESAPPARHALAAALDAGADAVLTKPFHGVALLGAVSRLLALSGAATPNAEPAYG